MIAGAPLRVRRAIAGALLVALCSCTSSGPNEEATPSGSSAPSPRGPQGAPLFAGAPPARMLLDAKPLDIDPSGAARYLVRARFEDAAGRPTDLVSGGDIEFVPSNGTAQWQTRLRFGGPAAIVSTNEDGPLVVRAHADVGAPVPDEKIATDTRTWTQPRVVARALGPHAVWIGWFLRTHTDAARVVRSGAAHDAAIVPAPSSGYVDARVVPGRTYVYVVSFGNRRGTKLRVAVPSGLRHGSLKSAAGKSAWLSFSPATADGDGYDKLLPDTIVARASAAGLRAVELRTTYGPFEEITAEDAPAIDAIVDGLAARGIATIAWTVPRSLSFEDLRAEVDAASYRTAKGNGFAALAVDLERGGYFLGDGARGYAALGAYLGMLRAAVGPVYPIVATVEDPYLEHLTNDDYPYREIARNADALQPMAYWTLSHRRALTPAAVRTFVAASHAELLAQAGHVLPIDFGFASAPQDAHAAPSAAQIAAGVAQAKTLGALGVTFFDWDGTQDATWRAIGRAPW